MPPAGVIGAGPPWPHYGQQQSRQQQYGPQTPNPSLHQQPAQYQYTGQYFPSPATQFPAANQQYMQQGSHQVYGVQSVTYPAQRAQQHSAHQAYNYQGHPSQYPSQIYPAHDHSTQNPWQAATPQPGAGHTAPAAAAGSAHNCFNCGMPGHWAMHCPYPHAVQTIVPTLQPYNGPPAKRQRTKYVPPVVTKYDVPDHVKQVHMAVTNRAGRAHLPVQQGTPATHNGQHGYIAPLRNGFINSTAPPTPISALSPGYSQASGSAPTSYSHVAAPGTITPCTPQASPHSASIARNGPFIPPPPSLPISENRSPQRPTPTNPASPHQRYTVQANRKSHPALHSDMAQGIHTAKTQVPNNRIIARDSDSLQTENVTREDAQSAEQEVDDLTLLDVPDIPTENPAKYGNRPCRLISAPLQAYSATALDVPGPPEGGDERIVSKYIRPDTLHAMLQDVRKSQHFPNKLDDPIFRFQTEVKPAPPTIPPAPPQSNDGKRQRSSLHEVQYKTVSNGPVQVIERGSTPVPQASSSGHGNEEYDPFDPAAGFPDDTLPRSPSPAASGYDPWSVADSPPALQSGPSELNQSRFIGNGNTRQHCRNDDNVHLDRKRSYADSFNHEPQPNRSRQLNKPGQRGHSIYKNRGGDHSGFDGYRR